MRLPLLYSAAATLLILLLAKPADAVRVNNLQNAPLPSTELEKACMLGDLEEMKFLIEHGSKANAKDVRGSKPIAFAVMSGQRAVVQFLLDNGANINEKDGASGIYPIHTAAFQGIGMTRYLVDHGADVNALVGGFGGALNIAVHQADLALAEFLLQRHANTETREEVCVCGDDGKIIAQNKITPLMEAASSGNLEMVKLLTQHHANVNAADQAGTQPHKGTALPSGPAMSRPRGYPILQAGDTPLAAAIKFEHKDVAAFLKKSGGLPKQPCR